MVAVVCDRNNYGRCFGTGGLPALSGKRRKDFVPAMNLADQIREHTILRRVITRDGTIIDLGMNDGRFAREIHAKFGCKVIGVEPNPRLAASIGHSDSIACQVLAIADKAGIAKLRIDDDSEASHIISDDGISPEAKTIEVPCVPLRVFLSNNYVTVADLLKIDIEGAELCIFEGIDFDVLQTMKQISVEFHAFIHPEQRPRVKKIISKMKESNFYYIDFSATWKDVLFINQSLVKIKFWEKAALLCRKYSIGLPALLGKIYTEGLGTVIKKIIARRFSRPGGKAHHHRSA